MKKQDPNHLLSYEIEEGIQSGKFKLPLTIGLMATAVLAMMGWYLFFGFESEDPNKPIPLIKASVEPTKELPDSSAQPEVPHQDKLIYSRINPEEKGPAVESILAEFEEPVDPKEIEEKKLITEVAQEQPQQTLESGLNEFKGEEEGNGAIEESSPKAGTSVLEEIQASLLAYKEEAKALQEDKVIKQEETTAAQEPAKSENIAEKVSPKAVPEKTIQKAEKLKSGYRVQVASLKSASLAKVEWARLKKDYPTTLGHLNPHYARVDLGAKKGIFYRVHAGDFKSKAAAENVCREMKSKKAGCLPIRF